MPDILLILFLLIVFFVLLFSIFFYSKRNKKLAKKTKNSLTFIPLLKKQEFNPDISTKKRINNVFVIVNFSNLKKLYFVESRTVHKKFFSK